MKGKLRVYVNWYDDSGVLGGINHETIEGALSSVHKGTHVIEFVEVKRHKV